MNRLSPVVFLILALLCNAGANILVKYAAVRRASDVVVREGFWAKLAVWLDPYLIGGALLFGLNLVAYSVALRSFRISTAYPIMVTGGYCLILLAGWFLFKERLTPTQFGGAGLILAGMWLVVR